jgi:hypothetical protein
MGTSVTQFFGIPLTTLQAPLPNRFVGQHDSSYGHDLFDVTVAEREAVGEPDTIDDDFRRKAMALGGWPWSFCIPTASMPYVSAVCFRSFVKLTIPVKGCLCVGLWETSSIMNRDLLFEEL